ncbi:MAG TPA: hypothetical protein VK525_03880 [Candidatus Saccharimonadales bacterium]|jgi:hypothetical protein|nr:hypothetical protein [Candidatus Saccharimonadales bacterium]
MNEYDWHPHYLAAVYEFDQKMFREKLDHAEIVLLKRSEEILPERNPDEYEALTRTMEAMKIMRAERLPATLQV